MMTPQQKDWLSDHPEHQPATQLSVVTIYRWVDEYWLTESGKALKDPPKYVPYMNGAFSSGDTLYTAQPLLHVARKVMIT